MLRGYGFDVKQHRDHFKDDEDDDVWIPDVKARGWLILSSDKRIARDALNVRAVIDCKAQVVTTSNNNTLPEFWAAAFVNGRLRIDELLNANPGPIYIQMSQHSKDHLKCLKEQLSQSARTNKAKAAGAPNDFFSGFIKF